MRCSFSSDVLTLFPHHAVAIEEEEAYSPAFFQVMAPSLSTASANHVSVHWNIPHFPCVAESGVSKVFRVSISACLMLHVWYPNVVQGE